MAKLSDGMSNFLNITTTTNIDVHQAKGTDWDKVLPSMRNKTYEGPSKASTIAILEASNKAYPFSKAKAIHDIGCGTAAITSSLIDAYHDVIPKDARLVASDFSSAMVKHVAEMRKQKVAEQAPCWDQVEAMECNAQDLSVFGDDTFTHIMGGYMYFMLPEPRKGLSEAFRVLTKENGGGVLALTSWKRNDWADVAQLIKTANPEKEMYKLPEEWASVDAVREELASVGFRDVEATELPVRMPVQKVEDVIQMIMSMPFVEIIAKDSPEGAVENAKEAMRDRLNELCPSLPGAIFGTAILGIGRK